MQILTQAMIDNELGNLELIRLTDDAHAGSIDADVLDQVASNAESKLLVYVAQKYTLPLGLTDANAARAVRAHCMAVCVYDLFVRRDGAATEARTKAFDAAIAWAKDIAKGIVGLPGESEAGQVGGLGHIVIESEDAAFSKESLNGL